MDIHERVDRIIASYEGGATLAAIAANQEISKMDVSVVLRLASMEPHSQIIALYRSGRTLQGIAGLQKPKISYQRVGQIIQQFAPDAHRERKIARNARNAEFRQEYEAGSSTTEIAARHGVVQSSVYAKLRRMDVIFRDKSGPKPKTVERTKAAFQLRAQGKKWREIADELGFKSMTQAWSRCHYHPELVP